LNVLFKKSRGHPFAGAEGTVTPPTSDDPADGNDERQPRKGLLGGASLGIKAFAAFLALEVLFKTLTIPAYLALLGHGAPDDLGPLGAKWAAVGLPLVALWFVVMVGILRRLERKTRGDQGRDAAHISRTWERAAWLITGAWGLEWSVFFSAGAFLAGGDPASSAFFVAAMTVGPLPVGYLVCTNLFAGEYERVSKLARASERNALERRSSVGGQALFLAMTLALVPASYMTSVGFAARAGALDEAELWMLVGFCFVAVVIFAAVCALLFARTISRRLRSMTDLVRTIAEESSAWHVGRLPIGRDDEIGALAGWTNVMIDRLVEVERAHAAMGASLAELNHSLEGRVEERTNELASANARLEEEMKGRLAIEVELRQAQKLEAIGRLAAGVAHEINTPVQFVADSLHFVDQSLTDIFGLFDQKRDLRKRVAQGEALERLLAEAAEQEEHADLPYLVEHVPKATARALEGLDRITNIVRAMKEFAHPDRKEMAGADLNNAIKSTLVIARNEYKYVADVETDLAELPLVCCHLGEVNQALLNIIVNAAHAIGDQVAGTETKGLIRITTRLEGDAVTISITDTGGGIPEAHRDRVFEPFFTTKEVGRGTGQGLAIARAVVVDKHGGELRFESRAGDGTTFFIRLPVEGRQKERAAA
jgi:signal transduction histidine kinase